MKSFNPSKWVVVVVLLLLGSYYLGRPVYWKITSQILDFESSQSASFKPDIQQEDEASQRLETTKRKEKGDPLDSNKQEPLIGIENLKNLGDASIKRENHKDTIHRQEDGVLSYKLLRRPIWEAPPRGIQMPPLSAFSLTKEMIKFRAKKNVIVATFANYDYLDFVFNWVKHLTKLGISNIIVGAMDQKCLEALFWAGVPTFDMGHQMIMSKVGLGTPSNHSEGLERAILVNKILSFDFELLMCDTDMVWIRNPLSYLERFLEAHVLISSDALVNTVDDEQLEVWNQSVGAYNIGFVHWRPSTTSKKIAQEWKEQLLNNAKIWDQIGFNDLLRKTFGPSITGQSGLFYTYDGSLKLGILPISIFCSGHTFFVQELYKQLKLEPYVVHTTFQFAAVDGKRHRLREAKLFYDEPEYYDPLGGIMSFNLSIPQNLLSGGISSVESHFALVNHQLKQVRDALAVATILNRTLIIPALWCRFDRLWFGHPGVVQGTKTPQPFLCPMDHIFEVNNMRRQMPEEEFGPSINFREYSFLDNSHTPMKFKASKLQVGTCNKDAKDCNSLSTLDPFSPVYNLPRNSNEDQLFAAFLPYKNISHIHFSSMLDVFSAFSDKLRDEKFRRRTTTYTGLWCCLENRHQGEIYYDIYWDEKPGWKPLPPYNPLDDGPPVSN